MGPNLTSTFHAVGGVWDYMYYQGNPRNRLEGGQSALTGPTDSWVVEWEIPNEKGPYTLVSHAFGTQAIKSAIAVIDPFAPGSMDVDRPHVGHSLENRIHIEMVGNSFHPKRQEVAIGTEVVFVNEDVFDKLDGELTGRHNAIVIETEGEERFASPELNHAETWRVTFEEPGHDRYFCSLHPYMQGEITVFDPAERHH